MNILQPLKFLLPALIPSWNFFDIISPSPRIEFSLLNSESEKALEWTEFRPRPEQLSLLDMIKRMFWNSKWNESLYLVSCAERIMENYTSHSETEILNRIEKEVLLKHENLEATHLQFRLLFIDGNNFKLNKNITFISRTKALAKKYVI